MWDTTKVTHSSNHQTISFQWDDGTVWVCLKNQGAKQKWLKVSGTHLQSDVATIRFQFHKKNLTELKSRSWRFSLRWCFLTEDGVVSSYSAVFGQVRWQSKIPPNFFACTPSAICFCLQNSDGLSSCTVCSSSAFQTLQFFLKHIEICQGHMQE